MALARILAGVATFAVGCALSSGASAQLGPCPALMPPPCITFNAAGVAQTVADLNAKREELQAAVEQIKGMTDLQGVLGSAGPNQNAPILGFVPPVHAGPKVSVAQASNAMNDHLTGPTGPDAVADDRRRIRSAAGDGYATALAIKTRLNEFDAAYGDLLRQSTDRQATALPSQLSPADKLKMCKALGTKNFSGWLTRYNSTGAGAGDTTVEEDWAINNAAKILLINMYAIRREVDAARLSLEANSVLTAKSQPAAGHVTRTDAAPPTPPAAAPAYNADLGSLMNIMNQLMTLKSAADTVASLKSGIQNTKDTQAEYQQMVAARDQSQRAVEELAAREARAKGVSASALLAAANQTMQAYDRTTWDDPSKRDVTKAAAAHAEAALDRMVNGKVSDEWSALLEHRAEAYKQEAFFRDIAEDAKGGQNSAEVALADYSRSIGIDAANGPALAAKIAELESQASEIYKRLNSAPADIVSIRDRIVVSSGAAQTEQAAQTSQPQPETAQN